MILVTGGTGFIGTHLAERLTAEGRPVRCLVRRTSPIGNLPANAVELAYGNLATGEGLREAVRGIDTIIHLAGVTKGRTKDDYFAGNATATQNLLAVSGDVRRFVHVSSLAAAGPSTATAPITEDAPPHPVSIYGRSKLAGEMAVRTSALWDRAIVIRPPVVYGPRDTDVYQLIRSVARGWMLRIGSADRRFSFVYVEDLVAGLIAAADHTGPAGKVYFIASPLALSWDDFGSAVARVLGRSVRTVTVPESVAYVIGMCAEGWSAATGKPGILSRDKVVEACCAGWVCDAARARSELGFKASTSLETGLRRTIDWYREAGWLPS